MKPVNGLINQLSDAVPPSRGMDPPFILYLSTPNPFPLNWSVCPIRNELIDVERQRGDASTGSTYSVRLLIDP